ncbi:MAG TPA: 6-carboxytetrahydropterin synthase [Candidatus Latescibacteria bacterium]|nr:6-carboxytetrahydropterin synthase [Candidatus Latescibacterota bacterium]
METIRVHSDFHAAHRQIGYAGKCRHVHGHTWRGTISLSTEKFPRNHLDMAIDFGDLKQVFRRMDHKMLVGEADREFVTAQGVDPEGVVVIPGSNPSVENIAYYCQDGVRKVIEHQYPGKGLKYHLELTLQETENNIFVVETDFVI